MGAWTNRKSAVRYLVAISALGFSGAAVLAQEPGLTGADKAADVVQARQLLMDSMEENMTVIDTVLAGKDGPIVDLKSRAYLINTLVTAFPHLFPPQTKPPVGAEDVGYQTNAQSTIWEDFPGFYGAVQDFASVALDASQVADLARFREMGAKMRAGCDSCHAKFMTPVEAPRQ